MSYIDRLGFLNYPDEIDFEHGRIQPCAEFAEELRFVRQYEHADGFMYPPMIQTHRMPLGEPGVPVPIPNTSRPAAVFDMPLSHEIRIGSPLGNGDLRHEDGGLIIHLAAFFFGTRLQFEGWHFDGRVPTKPTNSFTYASGTPAHFIRWVYAKWKTWPQESRRRYTNILYMHARTDSCIWEWDRFIYRYMTFDAICKFHQEMDGIKFTTHNKRIIEMCRRYDIATNEEAIKDLVRLRNDLFHEALWDGTTPGRRAGENFLAEKWLGNLNAKLIVASSGYLNEFTRRGWWFFGWQPFDRYT